MTPPRAYVPSLALIRALTRPQPQRCPFARPPAIQFARGKKSKARKAREAEEARLASVARKAERTDMLEDDPEFHKFMIEELKKDKRMAPLAAKYEQLENLKDPAQIFDVLDPPSLPESAEDGGDVWDVNLSTGKRTKRNLIGTREDQIKLREEWFMMKERATNPDYDPAELNKRMIDRLISNPDFADLTKDLKDIKAGIMTKEEKRRETEQYNREEQPAIDELNDEMREGLRDSLTALMNDPDCGDERADLQAVLDYLPSVEDFEDPRLGELMERATDKVNSNPKLQAKIQAVVDSRTPEARAAEEDFGKGLEEMARRPTKEEEKEEMEKEISEEDLDEMMQEMEEMLQHMNLDGDMQTQFNNLLGESESNTDPDKRADIGDGNGASRSQAAEGGEDEVEEEAEHVPPELQGLVDKLMADPRLMEKLDMITKLIEEVDPPKDPNDPTNIEAELAPDPYDMDDTRTATLSQRMATARASPEHSAAMRALRVKLAPQYNISPALKHFNQAIEFAYVGANDDVRRVLWRSYQKARTLPTFLQSLSDDAWDIMYYSQAVAWKGNQNRMDHLKLLLKDLKVAGKEGPPTHPRDLGQLQEAARLEAAQRDQGEATRVEGDVVDAARVA